MTIEEGEMFMTEKRRYDYIDIAKALGMLAVIWGHIHTRGATCTFVYAFDIPMFFFLSGMMFNNKKYDTFGKLVENRIKTLLIPYVIFSVATWVIWAAYNIVLHNDVNYIHPLLETVIAQGSGGYLVHDVPLWFVTCLFIVEVLYYFIQKLPDVWNIVICTACAVIGYFMVNGNWAFDFTKLPWNIECAMSAILFYCIGNLFVKHFKVSVIPEWVKNHKALAWIGVVVLTATLALLGIYNGHVSIGSNELGKNTLLLYVNGFIGTASTLIFASLFELAKFKRKYVKNFRGGVLWMGRNSFYFMAIHVPIKGFLVVLLAKVLKESTSDVNHGLLESLIVFVVTLICSVIVVIGINKVKTLIARKKQAIE